MGREQEEEQRASRVGTILGVLNTLLDAPEVRMVEYVSGPYCAIATYRDGVIRISLHFSQGGWSGKDAPDEFK